jgi:hypothetical protein
VQIHADAQVAQGHFKGQVEHLVSQSRALQFAEELVAFAGQVVTEPRKP